MEVLSAECLANTDILNLYILQCRFHKFKRINTEIYTMNFIDIDINDAFAWPTSKIGKMMTELDETMRCQICSEFFNNPHTLIHCGHIFCSECIRKHFDRTTNKYTYDTCPVCRIKAETKDMRPVRNVTEMIDKFKNVRLLLLDLVKAEANGTYLNQSNHLLDQSDDDDEDYNSNSNNNKKVRTDYTKVETRLSLPNFHGYNIPKIKKFLERTFKKSKVQLNLHGTKEELENRYKAFVHLHNAQLDANDDKALKVEEVVKEIHRRETAISIEARKSLMMQGKVRNLRDGKQSTETMKGFQQLITVAQQQKKKNQENVTESNDNSENSTKSSDDKIEEKNEKDIKEGNTPTIPTSYNWGSWRVLWNEQYLVPFYFNEKTKIGQFKAPEEMCIDIHNDDDMSEQIFGSNNDDNDDDYDGSGNGSGKKERRATKRKSSKNNNSNNVIDSNVKYNIVNNSTSNNNEKLEDSLSGRGRGRPRKKRITSSSSQQMAEKEDDSHSNTNSQTQTQVDINANEDIHVDLSMEDGVALENQSLSSPTTAITTTTTAAIAASTEVVSSSSSSSTSFAAASPSLTQMVSQTQGEILITQDHSSQQWTCNRCTLLNDYNEDCCVICENPAPHKAKALRSRSQALSSEFLNGSGSKSKSNQNRRRKR